MTPIGVSIGLAATATSWLVRTSAPEPKPSSSTTIRTDALNPPDSRPAIGLSNASSGVPPKPMTWRTTSGAL